MVTAFTGLAGRPLDQFFSLRERSGAIYSRGINSGLGANAAEFLTASSARRVRPSAGEDLKRSPAGGTGRIAVGIDAPLMGRNPARKIR
jgi:hypothetical protein